jgi:hypothetical protein
VFIGEKSSYQNICFVVLNDFIWRGELRLSVFLTLKTPKNQIWAQKVFFVSSGFQVLGWFGMFLGAMNWFNKIYRMFLGVLGQTWVQNNFLGEKK